MLQIAPLMFLTNFWYVTNPFGHIELPLIYQGLAVISPADVFWAVQLSIREVSSIDNSAVLTVDSTSLRFSMMISR